MQSLISVNTQGMIVARKDQPAVHFGKTGSGADFAAVRIVVDRPGQKNELMSEEQTKRGLKGQWIEVITTNPTSIKILRSAKNYSRISVGGNISLNVETKTADGKVFRSDKISAHDVRFVGSKPKAKAAAAPEAAPEAEERNDVPELTDEVGDPSLG